MEAKYHTHFTIPIQYICINIFTRNSPETSNTPATVSNTSAMPHFALRELKATSARRFDDQTEQ